MRSADTASDRGPAIHRFLGGYAAATRASGGAFLYREEDERARPLDSVRLAPETDDAARRREEWLQAVLFEQTRLLPIDAIDPAFGPASH
jgi:hypothetical protein